MNLFSSASSRILALVFIVIFIISFIFFYGRNDLFRFPFDANTWGTASDWVMVVVTALTAHYLVKSFQAQKENNAIQAETLREQQKITTIEQFIHRERVKPDFDLMVSLKGRTIENNTATFNYSFHFLLENGIARNIEINAFLFNHEMKENQALFSGTTVEKHPGDNIGFMAVPYIQKKLAEPLDGAEFVFRFEFFLEYDDILNNRYKQSIMFYEDSSGVVNKHIRGQKLVEK